MSDLKLFIPITKVDEARREVWGVLAEERPDKSGEMLDYSLSKPFFEEWSQGFAKATDGKSLGNLRAMHQPIAAGKFIAVEFNDAEKRVEVGARVIDDQEWVKVVEGVYTGFSIGGSYVGKSRTEKVDGATVKRYTAKPVEGSLVDNPAMYGATFTVVKSGGETEMHKFIGGIAVEPTQIWACQTKGHEHIRKDEARECIAALAKVEGVKFVIGRPKGSTKTEVQTVIFDKGEFTLTEAKKWLADHDLKAGEPDETDESYRFRQRDPGSFKAGSFKTVTPGKMMGASMKKGMWDVSRLADVLATINEIRLSSKSEREYEQDDSNVPDLLAEWLDQGTQILTNMVAEETSELTAEAEAPIMEMSAKLADLRKKGAMLNRKNMERVQAAIIALKEMMDEALGNAAEEEPEKSEKLAKGVKPSGDKKEGTVEEKEELQKITGDLAKFAGEFEVLRKAHGDTLAKVTALETELGQSKARIEVLEKAAETLTDVLGKLLVRPAETQVAVRAVAKEEDGVAEKPKIEKAVTVEQAMKIALASPIRPSLQ